MLDVFPKIVPFPMGCGTISKMERWRGCHHVKKGKKMKTTMLSVIGCALLAAGALEQARAQTTNTNVTVNVNIALSGVVASNEDRSMPVHITTKDVT